MKLDQELEQFAPERETVLTVGVFDGVHLGHQHLIANVVDCARRTGRIPALVTFSNHPATVVRPHFQLRYLMPLEERIRRVRECGIEIVAPITFDHDLADLDVRSFVSKLMKHLKMRALVIGPDFAMGHNRKGDSVALTALGRELGFTVDVVELLLSDGHAVNSTAIRNALARGDVETVRGMLGRVFAIEGEVVHGQKRGRLLGYPTANLDMPPHMATPADGVYATWAIVGGQRHMSATSIGVRPTFSEGWRTIEAFLMDFDGDLYGQDIKLEFVRRLRDELKFDSVALLLEQMARDVEQSREILSADFLTRL
jgi:riboflavin kinase/FMN adenylyltransferase